MFHRIDNCSKAILCTVILSIGIPSAQAQECEFDIGPDTTLCHGQHLFLHAPDGTLEFHWQNGFQSQMISADTTGTYWCSATFLQPGTNVVVNGDFSLGDEDFSTDFVHGSGGTWGELSLEGTYAITTDPSLVHVNFTPCGDHTGGGSMLVVNGSPLADADIWCQTIDVAPNTYYAFSAWLMSTTPSNPAIMDFQVNGVSLGTPLLASSTTCQWDQFYALWNSGDLTSVTICIINQQLAVSGNDFALDDISFSPLCSYTDSIHVTVLPAAPQVDAGANGALCPGDSAEVLATLVPDDWPLQDVSYSWSTGAVTPGITVTEPGEYTVTASGRCLNSQATVEFLPDTCEPPVPPATELYMPNVFSPNGDGVNDGFGPIILGDPDGFSMVIRNRWGQEVFTSRSASAKWDGRVDGGPLPAGTYYWIVKYGERHDDGTISPRELTGNVTLLGAR
jgi:gliding motility-associated-like protein